MTMQTAVAALLIDIEAHLRQLGQWQEESPPASALASSQPFCIDTLTLAQWLQFVFLPRMYHLLETEQALPARCGITPVAEEYFVDASPAARDLLTALKGIDLLLSGET